VRIGVESWAYHRYFGDLYPWEERVGTRWTAEDFCRRAAELGVDEVALQSIHLGDGSPERLARLQETLDELGLRPALSWGHSDGLRGGTSPEREGDLHAALDTAAALGAHVVRIVCGDHTTWSEPVAPRKRALALILERAAAAAAARGLELAIENHADFATAELVDLVRTVGAPNVGICFDDGNAMRVGESPLQAAELVAGLVRMVHIKDLAVLPEAVGDPGGRWPTVPLGAGEVDVDGVLDRLAAGGFDGSVFVELSSMHPSWPDEDDAVRRGVDFLRRRAGDVSS